MKVRVFPFPPGVCGESAQAPSPPAVSPSAFPPGFVPGSRVVVTCVALTGVVPLIDPTATELSLPGLEAGEPSVGRWIWRIVLPLQSSGAIARAETRPDVDAGAELDGEADAGVGLDVSLVVADGSGVADSLSFAVGVAVGLSDGVSDGVADDASLADGVLAGSAVVASADGGWLVLSEASGVLGSAAVVSVAFFASWVAWSLTDV